MEFLLEINTEEMPAPHVKAGLSQLKEKIERELQANHIMCHSLETYGTCRRLVAIGDFAPKQEDREEVIIGPPKAVAFAADGSPAQAAIGFARSQHAEVGKLQVIPTLRGEYVGLKKITKGRPTGGILAGALPDVITSLSFPKMMKWGEVNIRFSRPIKRILCLWGGKVLAFSIEGLKTNGLTSGHKLHSPQPFKVISFREYRSGLKKNKVILSADERKYMILNQIEKRLRPLEAQLYPDEELLEKLTYDVEYPYVFLGEFPQEYLRLPLEVLSVAMKEGQKLFSVIREGRQLPFFLGVADALSDRKSLIRRGNERVLRARLEDARFFWEQDLKVPLAQRAAGLRQVVFQEKLGHYENKSARLKQLVAYLCDRLDENKLKKDAVQAAELCKVDLLTEMVREFPSLQGKMGGLYAKEEGYPSTVSRAIYEHYQPAGLEDPLPSSNAGALLSLADRVDSIVGVVGIGVLVTGSSDPFGLRRHANGICRIVLDRKLPLSFDPLLEKAFSAYGDSLEKSKQEITEYCRAFFGQRLRFIYEGQGYRYDLVEAALSAGLDPIYFSYLRLIALASLQKSPHFEPFILMAKRVNNILRGLPPYAVNPDLFAEKEEQEIWSSFCIIRDNALPLIAAGEFVKAQNMIFKLQAPLSAFFDKILVMAEDKRIRQNRLALLQALSGLLLKIADFSHVVVEGEKKERAP
ncbi:MAG: glycine--tRNA ligase subunit beta [Candidatus Aminicenantes bacterium RBG_13_59_9]|nr:MAG: glycine--tRNA ligase subunit beta [Candidatus Aminicenantes bacterium RBG_13_59_9]